MAMLVSNQFLVITGIGWLLYSRKCAAFVHRTLCDPAYSFLHVYNCLNPLQRFALLLLMQVLLVAPVLAYGSVVIAVAWHHQYFQIALALLIYFLLLCLAPAAWYLRQLHYPHTVPLFRAKPLQRFNKLAAAYPIVLIRFIFSEQKMVLAGIKVFTCGMLYGMVSNNTLSDYDVQFPFLFFNFGIVANGLVIYRTRIFEESRLAFYRGMPVSLLRRWLVYAAVYGLLLVPEWTTIFLLTPAYLHTADAWSFSLCALSVLLLLNSISLLDDFSMKGYLRVLLVVLCIEYFFVIAGALTALYCLFLVLGVAIFFGSYYSFERGNGQIGN
jgi:hypothetical protein